MKKLLFLAVALMGLATSAQAQIDRPKLVVGVVVDQMRWDYLYTYDSMWRSDGGIRRLLDQGYSCGNTMIDYLPTFTACGHSCVYTGTTPAFNGVVGNTMIIHGIVDEGERLSSLHITKDYRIILPDYDNMEITIPDLPKAVFILFLKHPEGIRFKDLANYHDELLRIYRVLNPIGGTQRQKQSIQELTNPLSNSINEKCARIKEAFVQRFDDRLARHYYISGKRGEPKRIALPPSLVVWEQ